MWADAFRGQEPLIGRAASEEGTGDARLRSRQCRAVIQVTHRPGTSSPNSPLAAWTFATAFCLSPCAQAGCPRVPVTLSHSAPCGTQISAWPSPQGGAHSPRCSPGHEMRPRTAPRTALPCTRQPAPHLHTSLRTRPCQPDTLPLPLQLSSGVICHQEAFSGPRCAPITPRAYFHHYTCVRVYSVSLPAGEPRDQELGLVDLQVPRP